MTLVLQMNKFQTFHAFDVYGDFSGTSIQSSFPITVLSGNRCIKIGGGACDHTVSQMTSVETYGREFVTPDLPKCGSVNNIRIMSSEAGTTINISNVPTTNLPQVGDLYTFSVPDRVSYFVSADKPIMMGFFAGGNCNGDMGDPMMVLIPPFQQYEADYSFATVNVPSNPFQNSLTIVIPEINISGLILDGNNVSPLGWRSIQGQPYLKIKDFTISDGGHIVYHENPTVTFLAISSGVASFNSYGYSTGQRLALINTVCTFSNSTPGDIVDNDCDGSIDEEIKDGIDNDGDGLIDEDLASQFCAPRRENDILRCDSNPCMNTATCVECRSFWKCECLPGFTGDQCETEIDECESFPCLHGSECMDLINEYKCHCLEGYTGFNCQTDINECNEHHCHHDGTCLDFVNDYQCVCSDGYNGTNCEIDIDDCNSNPCRNDATCVDGISSWTCSCLPGFTGVECETDMNECDSNPCLRNGSCIDIINGFSCQCQNDTSGKYCETWVDNCQSVQCPNGGTCKNEYAGYVCECPYPWHGDRCEYKKINKTEECTELQYTECSCFLNKLRKPEAKSYVVMSGLIGIMTGLVYSIAAYILWLLLTGTFSSSKIAPEFTLSASDQDIKKSYEDDNKKQELPKTESNSSISVSPSHCDCFVDHTGYDHFQRYDPKSSRFKVHRCRHK